MKISEQITSNDMLFGHDMPREEGMNSDWCNRRVKQTEQYRASSVFMENLLQACGVFHCLHDSCLAADEMALGNQKASQLPMDTNRPLIYSCSPALYFPALLNFLPKSEPQNVNN